MGINKQLKAMPQDHKYTLSWKPNQKSKKNIHKHGYTCVVSTENEKNVPCCKGQKIEM